MKMKIRKIAQSLLSLLVLFSFSKQVHAESSSSNVCQIEILKQLDSRACWLKVTSADGRKLSYMPVLDFNLGDNSAFFFRGDYTRCEDWISRKDYDYSTAIASEINKNIGSLRKQGSCATVVIKWRNHNYPFTGNLEDLD